MQSWRKPVYPTLTKADRLFWINTGVYMKSFLHGIIFSVRPGGPTAYMSVVMNISPPILIFRARASGYAATAFLMSSIDSSTGFSRNSVAVLSNAG